MPKKDEKLPSFKEHIAELEKTGPQRLYLVLGPEDYLTEQYVNTLKKICLPNGEDDFSYKKFSDSDIDPVKLRNAIDSVPFMTERTMIEIRGLDLNKIKEQQAAAVIDALSDIPDYCTVVIVEDSTFEPDGRLKINKKIRSIGKEIKFAVSTEKQLISWVGKRFAAYGKKIDEQTAKHLIFISGTFMNRLIPEIEKVAAYAASDRIRKEDIEAVAHHIPEAVVFQMTDAMAAKNVNESAKILAELLSDKNNEPIMIIAVVGRQFRQTYIAKLAMEKNLGRRFVEENCKLKFGFITDRLIKSAVGFTLPQLKRAVEICCETDYAMKSSSVDDTELLKEAIFRIAVGETDAKN